MTKSQRRAEERVVGAAMRWSNTHSSCVGYRKRENLIQHFKRCPFHGNTVKLLQACRALAKSRGGARKSKS